MPLFGNINYILQRFSVSFQETWNIWVCVILDVLWLEIKDWYLGAFIHPVHSSINPPFHPLTISSFHPSTIPSINPFNFPTFLFFFPSILPSFQLSILQLSNLPAFHPSILPHFQPSFQLSNLPSFHPINPSVLLTFQPLVNSSILTSPEAVTNLCFLLIV